MKEIRKRNIMNIIGCSMILFAVLFFIFALSHPEYSFPWSNDITYLIYGIYFIVNVLVFIL